MSRKKIMKDVILSERVESGKKKKNSLLKWKQRKFKGYYFIFEIIILLLFFLTWKISKAVFKEAIIFFGNVRW